MGPTDLALLTEALFVSCLRVVRCLCSMLIAVHKRTSKVPHSFIGLHCWVQLTALNTVSSIDASLVYCAEPVLGAALAFLVLGER